LARVPSIKKRNGKRLGRQGNRKEILLGGRGKILQWKNEGKLKKHFFLEVHIGGIALDGTEKKQKEVRGCLGRFLYHRGR